MASKQLDWIRAATLIVGTGVATAKAVIDFRRFRRDEEKLEYTRKLQKTAWKQVMEGELSEAKVGDIHVKATRKTRRKRRRDAPAGSPAEAPVQNNTPQAPPTENGETPQAPPTENGEAPETPSDPAAPDPIGETPDD